MLLGVHACIIELLRYQTITFLNGRGTVVVAMAALEARMSEVEKEVTQMKIHMETKDKGLEEQKKVLLDYIDKEFATHKSVMQEIVEGAKVEFAAQRMNLHTLDEATEKN